MHIGFTGTQSGMTKQQLLSVDLLIDLFKDNLTFSHGDCIGSDEQAYISATMHGAKTISRPCTIESKRAFTSSDKIYDPIDPIDRNHLIVDESDLIIATPKEENEILRSGTWATIRYAKKQNKPLIVIMPSGYRDLFNIKTIALIETKPPDSAEFKSNQLYKLMKDHMNSDEKEELKTGALMGGRRNDLKK